jgi:hypothetical protein
MSERPLTPVPAGGIMLRMTIRAFATYYYWYSTPHTGRSQGRAHD